MKKARASQHRVLFTDKEMDDITLTTLLIALYALHKSKGTGTSKDILHSLKSAQNWDCELYIYQLRAKPHTDTHTHPHTYTTFIHIPIASCKKSSLMVLNQLVKAKTRAVAC